MKIKIKKLHPDAKIPTKMTKNAAGFDLYALEETVYELNHRTISVRTGISLAIPKGYEGQIRSRSGLVLHRGVFVANSPGTIDSDYRGEIIVLLDFLDREYHSILERNFFYIKKHERIAQLVVNQIPDVEFEEVEELDITDRGDKGFGSTGR